MSMFFFFQTRISDPEFCYLAVQRVCIGQVITKVFRLIFDFADINEMSIYLQLRLAIIYMSGYAAIVPIK